MTIANVDLFEILIKRGDAISSAAYVGPLGEPLYDTGLQTLRIQDGATPGGQVLATANQVTAIASNVANLQATVSSIGNLDVDLSSNVSVLQGNISMLSNQIANIVSNVGVVQASVYGDANVAAYLPTDNTIINIRSGITGANAAIITANSAVVSYVNTQDGLLQSGINAANAATIAANAAVVSYIADQSAQLRTEISSVNANISTANAAVVGYVNDKINSVIGGAPAALETLNLIAANLAADSNSINTIISAISSTNTNITVANSAVVSYVNDRQVAITNAWQANAALQQGLIHALQTSVLAQDANLGVASNNISDLMANAAIQESEISDLMSDITVLQSRVYGNANVALYLTTGGDPVITGITSNVVSLQTQIYGNANVATYMPGYTGTLANSSSIQALNSNVSAIQSNIGDLSVVFSETGVSNVAQVLGETIRSVQQQGSYISDLQDRANVAPESFTVTGNLTAANILANGIFYANTVSHTGYSPLSLVALTGRYEDLIDGLVLADIAVSGKYADIQDKPDLTVYATQTQLAANVNMLSSNVAIQANLLGNINANLSTITNNITALLGNAASQASLITNLQAISYSNVNVAAYLSSQNITSSNLDSISSNLNILTTNLTDFTTYANNTFSTSSYGNAEVATYLPADSTILAMAANIGAFETYANLAFGTSSYGNANVATYLSTYGGNVQVANIVFADTSIQSTAWTGNVSHNNVTGLAAVATTGDYNDLLNKPNITSSPAGAGSPGYTDVWVLSVKGTDNSFWTSYDLTGNIDQLFSFTGFSSSTVSSQQVYGHQFASGDKVLVINDGSIQSNSFGILVEFPANPTLGDTFAVPVVTTPDSAGVSRLIFKPAAGQQAITTNTGGPGIVYAFGPGTATGNIAAYVDLTTQYGSQPISWVYAGNIGSVPTWYQMFF
jgi:hypothetical protein